MKASEYNRVIRNMLSVPLPALRRPLPGDVWLSSAGVTGRDEISLGIVGLSRTAHKVPWEVTVAAEEYWDNRRERIGFKTPAGPTWGEQVAVLLGLWILYEKEMQYVAFEPVTESVQFPPKVS